MCIKLNCQVEAAAGNFHFSRSFLVSIDSDETCPPDSWLEFHLRISPCLFFNTHYHCSCSFLPELVVEAVPVSVMLTVAIKAVYGYQENRGEGKTLSYYCCLCWLKSRDGSVVLHMCTAMTKITRRICPHFTWYSQYIDDWDAQTSITGAQGQAGDSGCCVSGCSCAFFC